jgi:hypothetical protein
MDVTSPSDASVIGARHTDRESALLVRRPHPVALSGWRTELVTLEERTGLPEET